MRLVSYGPRGSELPGVLIDDEILPLPPVMTRIGLPPTGGIRSVLPFLGPLGEAVDAAIASGDETVPVEQTRLGPPIPDPPNLFNCGANYFAHLMEHGLDAALLPTLPVMFMKPISALSGPTDAIVRPRECRQLDYEAELALIIGKEGRDIKPEHAYDHIFGYTIVNDVTARDRQRNHKQWFLGKSLETFCPMVPWIATSDRSRESRRQMLGARRASPECQYERPDLRHPDVGGGDFRRSHLEARRRHCNRHPCRLRKRAGSIPEARRPHTYLGGGGR